MEDTAKKLESLIGKAESELDTLSYKVNQEYLNLANAQRTDSKTPSELVGCVQALRTELKQVAEEVADIHKQQQDLMVSLQAHVATLCSQFDDLSSITGPAATQEGDDNSNGV